MTGALPAGMESGCGARIPNGTVGPVIPALRDEAMTRALARGASVQQSVQPTSYAGESLEPGGCVGVGWIRSL